MNQLNQFKALRGAKEFSDTEILKILSPSMEDRDRSMVVNPDTFRMPAKKDSAWRLDSVAGYVIPKDEKSVVSNFFMFKDNALREVIFHYDVKIYPFKTHPTCHTRYVELEDKSQDSDVSLNYSLIKQLRIANNWVASKPHDYGMTYDGHSALFTTKQLFEPGTFEHPREQEDRESTEWPKAVFSRNREKGSHYCDVGASALPELSEFEHCPVEMQRDFAFDLVPDENQPNQKYHIRLRQVDVLNRPVNAERVASAMVTKAGRAHGKDNDQSYVRALDVALLTFVRGQAHETTPKWIFQGAKAFNTEGQDNIALQRQRNFLALRGYSVAMKSVMSGISLVCDMTVSCFLDGGDLTQFICRQCGFRNEEEMASKCPLNPRQIDDIQQAMKGTKIRIKHLNHSKKFRALGPAANSRDSEFESVVDGTSVTRTVAQYFQDMAEKNNNYAALLKGKCLRWPQLPTVNVGTKTRQILVPIELIMVPSGQSRHQLPPQVVAQVIKEAAVKPQLRMTHISHNNRLIHGIKTDDDSKCFGISEVETKATKVKSQVLSPAKILYRNNQTIDPGLAGTWNMASNMNFSVAPPNPIDIGHGKQGYKFAVLCVGASEGELRRVNPQVIAQFGNKIAAEATKLGVPSVNVETRQWIISNRHDDLSLDGIMAEFQREQIRIVVVIMTDDGACYSTIKNVADYAGIATQCCKYKNVEREPSGYLQNLMLKINTKIGGVNHTLATRSGEEKAPTFQSPPASIGWVFDEPTMLIGMDISHPEPGEQGMSMASVVASLDGSAWQYAAHMSAQDKKEDVNTSLLQAMIGLVRTFKRKNNSVPHNMIVYRDGISEGQYNDVLNIEIAALRDAIKMNGADPAMVKITFVACSKRHATRLVYNDGTLTDPDYVNPCAGVVVDATGIAGSGADAGDIVSGTLNEFYLNSHAAIQGTSKCTKYTLLYDEIGFKIAELELLTYWSTYLYCRCNRSVSLAAPAYYARWAAQRARVIASQCTERELPERLKTISEKWSALDSPSTMFFI